MGTPEDCVEQILRFRDEGVIDYLKLSFRLPLGPSMEEADECLALLATEVLPSVRRSEQPAADVPSRLP